MPRYSKKEKEFKALVESAFSGEDESLSQIVQACGFIHPDNGFKSKFFNGIVSRQSLKRWEKEGLPVNKIGRSMYYPMREFIEFFLDRTLKNRGAVSQEQQDWKATDAEFVAKRRRLEYEKELGQYIPIDDVKRVWCDHINACRKRLLAIPRTMATRLVGETKRATIEKELRLEVNSALEELSE